MNYKCGKIIVSGNFHMLTFTSKTNTLHFKVRTYFRQQNLNYKCDYYELIKM